MLSIYLKIIVQSQIITEVTVVYVISLPFTAPYTDSNAEHAYRHRQSRHVFHVYTVHIAYILLLLTFPKCLQ